MDTVQDSVQERVVKTFVGYYDTLNGMIVSDKDIYKDNDRYKPVFYVEEE